VVKDKGLAQIMYESYKAAGSPFGNPEVPLEKTR